MLALLVPRDEQRTVHLGGKCWLEALRLGEVGEDHIKTIQAVCELGRNSDASVFELVVGVHPSAATFCRQFLSSDRAHVGVQAAWTVGFNETGYLPLWTVEARRSGRGKHNG